MTQISYPSSTHPASVLDSVPYSTPGAVRDRSDATPVEDEEDFTIKCGCVFTDDDGNTVQCEKCDTWQHILCYYPNTADVPENHYCVDCVKRVIASLDTATERQRSTRIAPLVTTEKKLKPAKKGISHKKKSRDQTTAALVNGFSNETGHLSDGKPHSPRDHTAPPSKKAKISHKTSQSVSSIAGAKRINRSPTKSPPPPPPSYSPEFVSIDWDNYKDLSAEPNSFNRIDVPVLLRGWIDHPETIPQNSEGSSQPENILGHLSSREFEELPWPKISIHKGQETKLTVAGSHPQWRYVTVDTPVSARSVVGELKGAIGNKNKYEEQYPKRWGHLRHSDPFVIMHPHLPIYVDSKTEGTSLRFVRRSCRPNVELKTIVTDRQDYHNCFHATKDLPAESEITMAWDKLVMAYLNNGHKSVDDPEDLEQLISWFDHLLANFGGCACDKTQECAFNRFRRAKRSLDGSHTNGAKTKKRKSASSVSLPNGRAGSEPQPHSDPDESRSSSGSGRSKPQSRDLTPMTHLSSDVTSEREKRKLAAMVSQIEQRAMEDHDPSPKKKKRTSGGSNLTTPLANSSVRFVDPSSGVARTNRNQQKQLGHTDTSESSPTETNGGVRNGHPPGSKSPTQVWHNSKTTKSHENSRLHSPDHSNVKIQSTARSNYVNASTQTVLGLPAAANSSLPLRPQKPFVPLARRLLHRCHQAQAQAAAEIRSLRDRTQANGISSTSAQASSPQLSPITVHNSEPSPTFARPALTSDGDTIMGGIESTSTAIQPVDPNIQKSRPQDHSDPSEAPFKHPPPSNSGVMASPDKVPHVNGFRSADLRVDLPSTPAFTSTSGTSSTQGTPTSSASNYPQSPFGMPGGLTTFSPSITSSIAGASPVKKRISLSDYQNRKKKVETPLVENIQLTTSPPQPTSTPKLGSSLSEEIKAPAAIPDEAVVADNLAETPLTAHINGNEPMPDA
jgi:uncharacterized protein